MVLLAFTSLAEFPNVAAKTGMRTHCDNTVISFTEEEPHGKSDTRVLIKHATPGTNLDLTLRGVVNQSIHVRVRQWRGTMDEIQRIVTFELLFRTCCERLFFRLLFFSNLSMPFRCRSMFVCLGLLRKCTGVHGRHPGVVRYIDGVSWCCAMTTLTCTGPRQAHGSHGGGQRLRILLACDASPGRRVGKM
jgi:hypothetical protein